MDTLKYLKNKYQLRFLQKLPIELPLERFYSFPKLLTELNFKVGAEIGVATGRYSAWLFRGVKDLKLYAVDPWLSYEDYVESYDQSGQADMDQCFEMTKERLAGKNVEYIRKTSMEAVKIFPDNSLDFVFIDGNHSFQYVIADIAEWSKKVKVGGIISGHDYWNSFNRRKLYKEGLSDLEKIKLCQVKDAVDAWTATNQIKPWFIMTERIKGKKEVPSWFWIKT